MSSTLAQKKHTGLCAQNYITTSRTTTSLNVRALSTTSCEDLYCILPMHLEHNMKIRKKLFILTAMRIQHDKEGPQTGRKKMSLTLSVEASRFQKKENKGMEATDCSKHHVHLEKGTIKARKLKFIYKHI